MLYVYFGGMDYNNSPDWYVHGINSYFDSYFETSWTDNEWAKRVISEVDKSTLLYPKVVDSPWLDIIPITGISGGAKTLIMANAVEGVVFDGNSPGDNCYPLFLELSKTKDIMLTLEYSPQFKWVDDVPVYIVNNDKIVQNMRDFNIEHLALGNEYNINIELIDWPVKINKDAFHKPDPFLEKIIAEANGEVDIKDKKSNSEESGYFSGIHGFDVN